MSGPRNQETCQVWRPVWAAARKKKKQLYPLCTMEGKTSHSAISLGEGGHSLNGRLPPGQQARWQQSGHKAWPRWRLAVNGSYSQPQGALQGLSRGPPRGPQGRHRWLVMPDDHSVTKWRLLYCHKT